MPRASIAAHYSAASNINSYRQAYLRQVSALPPGMCPVQFLEAFMHNAASQTCGKCVPCRDGLPRLARYLEKLARCEASKAELDEMCALAQMMRDTSDCIIGEGAARTLLCALDDFEEEITSHLEQKKCAKGAGQVLPCEALCPAHVDIAAYIAHVEAGNYQAAVSTIRKDNPFPSACAYVCEHPCEARCRRTLVDAPVNIRGIKRYAVDNAPAHERKPFARHLQTGRKIAVVGAGPSGLTCAYFLSLMGHDVEVFEARAQAGGMLRYGIPEYRFPRARLDEDIESILAIGGIRLHYNVAVDTQKMEEFVRTFDAIYVAIGAQAGKSLRIEGTSAHGVMSAVSMLGNIGEGNYPDFSGKHVVVVGGGNVAMDCARTSIRAGAAQVSVVYRRRKEDMTALPEEIEAAIAEGVELLCLESPDAIEADEKGNCVALITQPQMIGKMRGERPAPVNANKPQRRIEADVVLLAVGQSVEVEPFEAFGMKTTWGTFDANDQLHAQADREQAQAALRKKLERVFVGGDCQTGPSSLINAVAAGRVAACSIDEYLGYHHLLSFEVGASELTPPDAGPRDHEPKGRAELAFRPARERKLDFDCVELPLNKEEVRQECGRCLRCDVFGCATLEGGRVRYV